jgi:ATP-dependent DNA helicase DinG
MVAQEYAVVAAERTENAANHVRVRAAFFTILGDVDFVEAHALARSVEFGVEREPEPGILLPEFAPHTGSSPHVSTLQRRSTSAIVFTPDVTALDQLRKILGWAVRPAIEIKEFLNLLAGWNDSTEVRAFPQQFVADEADSLVAVAQMIRGLLRDLSALDKQFLEQLATWSSVGLLPYAPIFRSVAEVETVQDRTAKAIGWRARGSAGIAHHTMQNGQGGASMREEVLAGAGEISALFGSKGGLSMAMPGYECRSGQIQMAAAVTESLETGDSLLVEAGTGIGKSLAYLVPAANWSLRNHKPVVVSTFTRGLQEQLVRKDSPIARTALAAAGEQAKFKVVTLKGRSNYLCLRRWEAESRSQRFNPEMASLMIKIAFWLRATETGDKAELMLTPAEERQFQILSASTDNCIQTICRGTFGSRCFLNRSRSAAQKANIVVTNHALLFSSLGEDRAVLPKLERVIVDEAHHLEAVATAQFSFRITFQRLNRLLLEYADLQGTSIIGHCGRAVELLVRSGTLPQSAADSRRAVELLREAVSTVDAARQSSQHLFAVTSQLLEDGRGESNGYASTRRILSATRNSQVWAAIEATWANLKKEIAALLRSSQWLLAKIGGALEDESLNEAAETELLALGSWQRQLDEIRGWFESFILLPADNYVYWLSGDAGRGEPMVCGAPLNVGELIESELFRKTGGLVLTSATLRTQGTFRLLKQQLGIQDATELVIDSPFDYYSSTLLFIARDVPEPVDPKYLPVVGNAIFELAASLEGRTLALFTSHAALRSTHEGLQPALKRLGIEVLAQDVDGAPNQLVERMQRKAQTVVLGVAAFWEGVDVPGEELSALVVTRLPFEVPTDPLVAARSEEYERPFEEYSLPRATLRFRQGFGRLIRSSTDRGVVAVLDSRIFTKRYGSAFLSSIAECTVVHEEVSQLGIAAKNWLLRSPDSK